MKKICCGGIIGCISGGNWDVRISSNIENCYNSGRIKSEKQKAGGIIGEQGTLAGYNELNIKNVYNIGEIIGTIKGAIFGSIALHNSTETITNVENVFYKEQEDLKAVGTNEQKVEGKIQQKSEDEMKSYEFINILNSKDNNSWLKWKKGENGYPIFM